MDDNNHCCQWGFCTCTGWPKNMYCSIGLYGRSLWQVMRRGAKVAIKQLLKYGRHPPMHDLHFHCHLRLHYLQHMIIMTKFCFMFIVIIITVFTINIIVLYRLQIGCESCKLMLEGAGLGGWEATLGFFSLSSTSSSPFSSSSCHHHLLLLFHHLLHCLLHHLPVIIIFFFFIIITIMMIIFSQ